MNQSNDFKGLNILDMLDTPDTCTFDTEDLYTLSLNAVTWDKDLNNRLQSALADIKQNVLNTYPFQVTDNEVIQIQQRHEYARAFFFELVEHRDELRAIVKTHVEQLAATADSQIMAHDYNAVNTILNIASLLNTHSGSIVALSPEDIDVLMQKYDSVKMAVFGVLGISNKITQVSRWSSVFLDKGRCYDLAASLFPVTLTSGYVVRDNLWDFIFHHTDISTQKPSFQEKLLSFATMYLNMTLYPTDQEDSDSTLRSMLQRLRFSYNTCNTNDDYKRPPDIIRWKHSESHTFAEDIMPLLLWMRLYQHNQESVFSVLLQEFMNKYNAPIHFVRNMLYQALSINTNGSPVAFSTIAIQHLYKTLQNYYQELPDEQPDTVTNDSKPLSYRDVVQTDIKKKQFREDVFADLKPPQDKIFKALSIFNVAQLLPLFTQPDKNSINSYVENYMLLKFIMKHSEAGDASVLSDWSEIIRSAEELAVFLSQQPSDMPQYFTKTLLYDTNRIDNISIALHATANFPEVIKSFLTLPHLRYLISGPVALYELLNEKDDGEIAFYETDIARYAAPHFFAEEAKTMFTFMRYAQTLSGQVPNQEDVLSDIGQILEDALLVTTDEAGENLTLEKRLSHQFEQLLGQRYNGQTLRDAFYTVFPEFKQPAHTPTTDNPQTNLLNIDFTKSFGEFSPETVPLLHMQLRQILHVSYADKALAKHPLRSLAFIISPLDALDTFKQDKDTWPQLEHALTNHGLFNTVNALSSLMVKKILYLLQSASKHRFKPKTSIGKDKKSVKRTINENNAALTQAEHMLLIKPLPFFAGFAELIQTELQYVASLDTQNIYAARTIPKDVDTQKALDGLDNAIDFLAQRISFYRHKEKFIQHILQELNTICKKQSHNTATNKDVFMVLLEGCWGQEALDGIDHLYNADKTELAAYLLHSGRCQNVISALGLCSAQGNFNNYISVLQKVIKQYDALRQKLERKKRSIQTPDSQEAIQISDVHAIRDSNTPATERSPKNPQEKPQPKPQGEIPAPTLTNSPQPPAPHQPRTTQTSSNTQISNFETHIKNIIPKWLMNHSSIEFRQTQRQLLRHLHSISIQQGQTLEGMRPWADNADILQELPNMSQHDFFCYHASARIISENNHEAQQILQAIAEANDDEACGLIHDFVQSSLSDQAVQAMIELLAKLDRTWGHPETTDTDIDNHSSAEDRRTESLYRYTCQRILRILKTKTYHYIDTITRLHPHKYYDFNSRSTSRLTRKPTYQLPTYRIKYQELFEQDIQSILFCDELREIVKHDIELFNPENIQQLTLTSECAKKFINQYDNGHWRYRFSHEFRHILQFLKDTHIFDIVEQVRGKITDDDLTASVLSSIQWAYTDEKILDVPASELSLLLLLLNPETVKMAHKYPRVRVSLLYSLDRIISSDERLVKMLRYLSALFPNAYSNRRYRGSHIKRNAPPEARTQFIQFLKHIIDLTNQCSDAVLLKRIKNIFTQSRGGFVNDVIDIRIFWGEDILKLLK